VLSPPLGLVMRHAFEGRTKGRNASKPRSEIEPPTYKTEMTIQMRRKPFAQFMTSLEMPPPPAGLKILPVQWASKPDAENLVPQSVQGSLPLDHCVSGAQRPICRSRTCRASRQARRRAH
jgi:hypothetical protein